MRDDELVVQVLAGNTAQFEALVDRYLPMVRGLCRSRVANPSSHDDLVQEVFLQGYLQLDRLRDASRFGPWLARIARNHCYSWLRSQSRRVQLDTRAAVETQRTIPAPDAIAMSEETADWVHKSIERLPEKLRDAMTLFYVEGLSIAEAARCLEIREGALKKRLQYGRQAVGEDLFAHFEPKAAPATETREQKTRVMAALPLAATPWKAGAAAGTVSMGLGVAAKFALAVIPVAIAVAAAVAIETGWRPAWPSSTASATVPFAVSKPAPASTSSSSSIQAAKTADTASTAPIGDLTLTVSFRVPHSEDKKVEEPLAANTRLWLVPVRFDRATLGRYLREAGADAAKADVLVNLLDEGRLQGGTWASVLAEVGIDRSQVDALMKKVSEAMERDGLRQEALISPVCGEARELVTDARGRLEATGLAAGRYLLSLEQPTPELFRSLSAFGGVVVPANTHSEQAVSIYDTLSAIRGRVVDANTGEPVKAVEVAVSGESLAMSVPQSQTNAEGRFEFGYMGTGYGPFTLRATCNAFTPVTVRGERRPATPTEVEIRLGNPRAVVSGRVTNADGTPAADVSISRESMTGDAWTGEAVTDTEGRYTLPHDGGRLVLRASAAEVASEPVTLDLAMEESASQDFVLPPWGSVALELRASWWKSVPDEIRNVILITEPRVSMGKVLKKKDGLFRYDYLKPGTYAMLFELKGFEGVRVDFQIPPTFGEQRIVVPLKAPQGGVHVRVLNADGKPAANGSFTLWACQSHYDSDGGRSGGWSCQFREGEKTDANGECLVQGLPRGEYALAGGDDDARFVAPTSDTVILRREPVDEELASPRLYLAREDIKPVDEKGNELPFLSQSLNTFVVTASGATSTSELEPGRNTIYAIKSGYTAAVASVDISPQDHDARRKGEAGAIPIKAIFGPGGSITGVLTDEAGAPLANRPLAVLPVEFLEAAEANWKAERSQWGEFMETLAQGAATKEDGSFRIDFLPPGRYFVVVFDHCTTFPVSGTPIDVRAGADTGPVTLVESAEEWPN